MTELCPSPGEGMQGGGGGKEKDGESPMGAGNKFKASQEAARHPVLVLYWSCILPLLVLYLSTLFLHPHPAPFAHVRGSTSASPGSLDRAGRGACRGDRTLFVAAGLHGQPKTMPWARGSFFE